MFNRLIITRKQKGVIEQQKAEVEQQKEVVELAHDELEEKNQEIMDSILYAKRIQSAILPPAESSKRILTGKLYIIQAKRRCSRRFLLDGAEGMVKYCLQPQIAQDTVFLELWSSVVCNNGLNRSVREHGLTIPGRYWTKPVK